MLYYQTHISVLFFSPIVFLIIYQVFYSDMCITFETGSIHVSFFILYTMLCMPCHLRADVDGTLQWSMKSGFGKSIAPSMGGTLTVGLGIVYYPNG